MTITIGMVSAALLEGLKWLIRLAKKAPEFDFSPKFYAVALAILNVLLIPAFAWLDQYVDLGGVYDMPANWYQWVLDVFLAALGALGTYVLALKPFKEYRRAYFAAKNGDG